MRRGGTVTVWTVTTVTHRHRLSKISVKRVTVGLGNRHPDRPTVTHRHPENRLFPAWVTVVTVVTVHRLTIPPRLMSTKSTSSPRPNGGLSSTRMSDPALKAKWLPRRCERRGSPVQETEDDVVRHQVASRQAPRPRTGGRPPELPEMDAQRVRRRGLVASAGPCR